MKFDRGLLVDTGFFFALYEERDNDHAAARARKQARGRGGAPAGLT